MNNLIEELKGKAFSGNDVLDLVDGESKLVRYPDLYKYDTIEEVLYPYNCFFLLYETKFKYGHWVCVILHDNGVLEFFDPYGYFIDHQLKFISDKYRLKSHQDYPYLSRLFLNSPYKIVANDEKLQKKYKNNSTCGRHIGLRMVLRDLPLKDYQKIMKKEGDIDADDKATYLTAFI